MTRINIYAPQKSGKNFKVILVLLVVLAAIFLIKFNPLVVKEDTFLMNNVPCSNQDQVAQVAHLQGQSILMIDSQALQQDLERKFLCINRVSVSRTSLTGVKVDITGRAALFRVSSASESSPPAEFTDALIDQLQSASPSSQSAQVIPLQDQTDFFENVSSNQENLLVDDTGLLFLNGGSGFINLPELTIIHPKFKLGEKIDEHHIHALQQVLEKLKALSLSVLSLRVKDATAVVKGQNPQYIMFDLDGPVDRELASLQLILKQITMDPGGENSLVAGQKRIKSIDLRFDKPVMVYASKH